MVGVKPLRFSRNMHVKYTKIQCMATQTHKPDFFFKNNVYKPEAQVLYSLFALGSV